MQGIRVSFGLVDLMQLNLVRRRLWTLALGEAFVHPDDLAGLAKILDEVLGEDFEAMLHEVRRTNRGTT